jgi:hypothetical protein
MEQVSKATIRVNYRPESEDPNKHCGDCFNFLTESGAGEDGRCFGSQVNAKGLCDIFISRSDVEQSMVEVS